jgi:hypothetical protein
MRWRSTLLVLGAFLLSDCSDKKLPNGYRIRIADRGKTWLHDPDNLVVLNYVTAVGHDRRFIFTETRTLRDKPPYGYENCAYHVTDTESRRTINLSDRDQLAVSRAKDMIRNTRTLISSRSCIH